jgi:ribosomal protein L37AE/L43A
MSPSVPPAPPETSPPLSNLPLKLLLLFLLTIFVSQGLIYLLHYGNPVGYLGDLLFASGVLGLVSGFGSRLVLRERRTWLRTMAALSMLTIGLILIGVYTGWKFGLGPLSFRSRDFDWKGLVQLVFGGLTAILSLHTWRRPPRLTSSVRDGTSPEPEAHLVVPDPVFHPKRIRSSRRPVGALANKPPAGRSIKRLPSGSGLKRRSRQKSVQFSTNQEDRCPYCLEPIQPNDPRGVTECKVCHTLHHADCWAITGICQVPHMNS